MVANVLPYTETVQEKHGTGREYRIRTFSMNIDQRDLTWHRSDTRSRTIHILQGTGWKFLVEDRPTIEFKVGIDYHLPKQGKCQLQKGVDDLVIRIEEHYHPYLKKTIL